MTGAAAVLPTLLALGVAATALVAAVAVLLRTRRPALALGVGLDLLLAAGLLRLSADQTWRQLATAATVVALRCLTTRGSRTGAAAWRGPRPATAGHHDHDLDR
ncbi:hypothetical protein [Kineococcus esterisolvens]|uniref:hypothetical protein n=1 Tax=unclassified Kineococcus TaxID=2621656 RepID=UPI003D7EFD4E